LALDPRLWALIRRYAPRYGLDPRAAAAVAMNESGGRFGAVGDSGTSFGPWQLHVGGALPRGKGAAWANSLPGVLYALRTMSNAGARGLHGQAAVNAIARQFERPANPGAEVAVAMRYYRTPSFARGSAAAGAGGGGIARGGGGAARRGGRGFGGGNIASLLSNQQPISVPAMAPLPSAAETLQNLFAAQPAQSAPASPVPASTAPGPAAFTSQLNSLHDHLLRL
jgi:hypothetical protein